MVLASTGTKELQELATLADKIMDVAATCGVSSVHPSALASHIDQMKSQLADLSRMFESLTSSFKQHTTCPGLVAGPLRPSLPVIPPLVTLPCVGIMSVLVSMQRSVANPAPFRETIRPATSGDEQHWPT